MRKIDRIAQARTPRNPWDLTGDEVTQLMQTYTQDKACILEQDAIELCHWAEQRKRGAYELHLALMGHVQVTVAGGVVTLSGKELTA